ncbi:MAG: hypothetical protein KAI61_02130 [Alphaproteobacteria bacterium]|nr:hypothetical protein [Alphaproteobacteria bacterium]MCK5518186.1 hypothetical protein [Alphaproteobacteria bacterium]MCK5556652.1 hypothetical protein [Alphaproteobacteria bacterium]MCK5658856.1 hypothetical protein [Alphaproteobacteria bacterium]
MTNDSINSAKLLTGTEITSALENLSYRYQILEACLIVEEYVNAIIELYLPKLLTEKVKDDKKIKLSFEQKLCLFEYFLNDVDKGFSKFPRMLQKMRNKVAHDRKHVINKGSLSEFYKKLGSKEKEIVESITKNTFKKIGKSPVAFFRLDPSEQFTLLMIWFTGGLEADIDCGSFQFLRIDKKIENMK